MKIVIVGGVAGGGSTAARIRRLDENAEIIVLERDDYVSFANCGLPYHIGGIIKERDSLLLQTPGLLLMPMGLISRLPPFNTVISNVPGIRETMYWNGARMDGSYPVSIVMDGVAMNITLVTYDKNVDFGIVACRRSMPHVQRIIDYMEDSLAAMEEAAGLTAAPGKPKAATKRKTRAAPRRKAGTTKAKTRTTAKAKATPKAKPKAMPPLPHRAANKNDASVSAR